MHAKLGETQKKKKQGFQLPGHGNLCFAGVRSGGGDSVIDRPRAKARTDAKIVLMRCLIWDGRLSIYGW